MEAPLAQVATPPQEQRGPQGTGGHPHKGTLRPPCFRPTWCPPALALLLPLTRPCSPRPCRWDQTGGRHSGWLPRGLSLGGRGGQLSSHTAIVPVPPGRNPGCRGSPPVPEKREAVPTGSAPRGSEAPGPAVLLRWVSLAGRPGLGIWDWELRAYFPTPRLGLISAHGSGMQRWALQPLGGQGQVRYGRGLGGIQAGSRQGPGGVQACCLARGIQSCPRLTVELLSK